tara:strand:+ start:741 stop:1898 length:1158 start_codon:yes stop_codon:yes gene_type:complete
MQKSNFDFYLLIVFFVFAFSQNNFPIVLIHGFMGWGRDELSGYYYWGGNYDLESELKQNHYEVYTVSVGPISTNYDRAIEVFYQIKGGQLDYGEKRSTALNTEQLPKSKIYDGFYNNWDSNNPIHIIAHSQGGQTAKMLEKLLTSVDKHESSYLLANSLTGWIASITTISTPHNGSTLIPIMSSMLEISLSLIPYYYGINIDLFNNYYNFDLEHWGLNKVKGENIITYYQRISNSKIMNPKNNCTWDLSLEGAMLFNSQYKTDSLTYYFTYSTSSTKLSSDSHTHTPTKETAFRHWPTAKLMGTYNDVLNPSWYENDGIVNTVSMSHPFGEKNKPLDENLKAGVWQIGKTYHMDHTKILGHGATDEEWNKILTFYKEHLYLLYSL